MRENKILHNFLKKSLPEMHSRRRNAVIAHLGLEPVADGIWAVWFSWKRIGFFDESKMKIVDTYGKTGRKKNV